MLSCSPPPLPFPHPSQQAAELLAGGFACHTSSDHSAGSPLPPAHGKGEEQEVRPRDAFAGGEAGEADEHLHPILRLGWRPLCNVTCNGLYGEFLGGHDKEMFIRCTSEPYRDLPLVDVASVRWRGCEWAAFGYKTGLVSGGMREPRGVWDLAATPHPVHSQCRVAAS